MATFKREIARVIAPATGLDEDQVEAALTLPQHADHGDFSFPCFPLAKTLRKAPALIAEELARTIAPPPGFTKIEALAGYLNFFADKALFTRRVVSEVLTRGAGYGDSDAGAGKPIVIDFSSPNMGKELAFHHLRGTMIGSSLSRVFAKRGHPVTRINHLGDWGTSYGKLIVMFLREGLGEADLPALTLERLNGLYTTFGKAAEANPALEDEAREAFARLEAGDAYYRILWESFREVTLVELRRLYAILNVDFDSWVGEAFFAGRLEPVLKLLESKKLLTISQGAEVVDLEAHGAAGMPPALIRKTDGSTLYITRDLAAALYRHEEYSFERSFYVVDNGQALHFQQLFKVLELMGCDWHDRCEHIPFGLVLHKSGEGNWEKGKTRSGQASLLKDVLEAAREKIAGIMAEKLAEKDPGAAEAAARSPLALQIAVGALVFSEMKNRRMGDIRFEWEQALSFEGDSGPYVQNAHVRLCSILRKAGIPLNSFEEKDLDGIRWDIFRETEAFAVAELLAQFADRIAGAAVSRDPCVLAQYALSLADATHRFLHGSRVLGSDEERERLLLVRAARSVLGQSLELIGVPAIERM
jgi:arginyl-tRNA synthetase